QGLVDRVGGWAVEGEDADATRTVVASHGPHPRRLAERGARGQREDVPDSRKRLAAGGRSARPGPGKGGRAGGGGPAAQGEERRRRSSPRSPRRTTRPGRTCRAPAPTHRLAAEPRRACWGLLRGRGGAAARSCCGT